MAYKVVKKNVLNPQIFLMEVEESRAGTVHHFEN